jgi:hypothetical protein
VEKGGSEQGFAAPKPLSKKTHHFHNDYQTKPVSQQNIATYV